MKEERLKAEQVQAYGSRHPYKKHITPKWLILVPNETQQMLLSNIPCSLLPQKLPHNYCNNPLNLTLIVPPTLSIT